MIRQLGHQARPGWSCGGRQPGSLPHLTEGSGPWERWPGRSKKAGHSTPGLPRRDGLRHSCPCRVADQTTSHGSVILSDPGHRKGPLPRQEKSTPPPPGPACIAAGHGPWGRHNVYAAGTRKMATGVTPATTPILPGPPLSAEPTAIGRGRPRRHQHRRWAPPASSEPSGPQAGSQAPPPSQLGSLLARRPAGYQPSVAPVGVILMST